jgi:hypothetical protein
VFQRRSFLATAAKAAGTGLLGGEPNSDTRKSPGFVARRKNSHFCHIEIFGGGFFGLGLDLWEYVVDGVGLGWRGWGGSHGV